MRAAACQRAPTAERDRRKTKGKVGNECARQIGHAMPPAIAWHGIVHHGMTWCMAWPIVREARTRARASDMVHGIVRGP